GSGKTLAFGLAMVVRLPKTAPGRPSGLVLVPTRELAAQVAAELAPLAAARRRRVLSVYGGTGYAAQRKALQRGSDIVVATPGRLEDLLTAGHLRLSDVAVVVVDEADRMADMGFLPAVRRLLDATPPGRQTLLFSATLDDEVDVLVRHYQRQPRRHSVVDDNDGARVEHLFWQAPRDRRVALTASLIDRHDRAIVFCRTRHGADRLARQLGARGIGAAAIHGSRTQRQRERALAAFKGGSIQALVATDIAARGIHIDSLPCVVHFDPAADDKDYAHRSGRTGRAGAAGIVVTLVGDEHRAAVGNLQRRLGLPLRLDQPVASRTTSKARRPRRHDSGKALPR
ncbi:MAG: DEAD/DEAH box helicase, partial [Acidimicrobiia bacterium]|nr:DEAD/DEAH box helicase [Acidimicrobiia bacterium]